MENLFLFVMAVYGFTFLVVDAEITYPIREWVTRIGFFERLLRCYFCVGVWVSLLFVIVSLFTPYRLKLSFLDYVLYVFSGASGAYLLNLLATLFESRIVESHVIINANSNEETDTSEFN